MMGLSGCFGGSALQTLKLASVPCSIFKPCLLISPPKTLFLQRNTHLGFFRAVTMPFTFRALSAPALQTPSITEENEKAVKPQWRAAIDFKWIRDNKDIVAANIENKNSKANLELVLQLYEELASLQKGAERSGLDADLTFGLYAQRTCVLTVDSPSHFSSHQAMVPKDYYK